MRKISCFLILILYGFMIYGFQALAETKGNTMLIRPNPQMVKQSSPLSLYPPNITFISGGYVRGLINSDLVITGRDFMPSVFQVRLITTNKGNIPYATNLNIVFRSATKIIARLPNQRMTGTLVAGYGTTESEVVLSPNFIVYGSPRITGITTTSFLKGSRITISGVDLYDLGPSLTYYHDGIGENMVHFGNNQTLLVVTDWTTQADKIQFTVPISCNPACQYSVYNNQYTPQNDHPISGNLWLGLHSQGFNTGLQVSYVPENPNDTANLTINSAEAPRWGNTPVSFVYGGGDPGMSKISLTGTGFKDAKAYMNDMLLNSNFTPDGRNGIVWIPYQASSGKIVLLKGKGNRRQVAKTQEITVVPKPRITNPLPFQQNTAGFYGIPINTEFIIKGFDLDSPRSVQGLTHSWELGIPNNRYSLQVIRHNSHEVVLKIVTSGVLSDYYFDPNFHQNYLQLIANANGEKKLLDWMKIFLKRQP